MAEQPVGPRCGNNPFVQLSDGDRKAIADFKTLLALKAAAQPYVAAAAWVDGDPLMEAIAATIWKHCARDDQDQPQAVCDDPRTIAAYAAAVARAQAEMVQANPVDRTAAALAAVRRLCNMTINDSIRAVAIDQAQDTLAAIDSIMGDEQPPLSPYYKHPACGFHWHGKDGMDIPIRDGQPICPRCEIDRLQETHKASLRRADQVNNDLMEEVQLYAAGTERPVLWSVYNAMHLRAANAEGALGNVRRIARRLAAHAAGFQDVLDDPDRAPWAKTVGADVSELGRLAAEAPQPDTETRDASPSNRRGLVHNAITGALKAAGDRVPFSVRAAATRAALAEIDAWHAGGTRPRPVQHTPGKAVLCPDCRTKGRAICMADTGTPCGPAPSQCDPDSGEPCANHEREQAHAEGEHCFCGPECEESKP